MPDGWERYARWCLALALVGLLPLVSGAEEATGPGAPPLGASEAELRGRFGDALRVEAVVPARSVYSQIAEARSELPGAQVSEETSEQASEAKTATDASRDPFAGQKRFSLSLTGDVQRVEFDLFADHSYRMRWQLASRFERPVMNSLVASLRKRWGEPAYDQTLHAAIGSGRSDLRRTGWKRDGRSVELRQLHPLGGGPMYLSLTDRERAHSIVEAGGMPFPQPVTSGDWWRRPQRTPSLTRQAEQDELVAALARLVDSLPLEVSEPGDGVVSPDSD